MAQDPEPEKEPHLPPYASHEATSRAYTLGQQEGRSEMKREVLHVIRGCLDRDPTLQKILAAVMEL